MAERPRPTVTVIMLDVFASSATLAASIHYLTNVLMWLVAGLNMYWTMRDWDQMMEERESDDKRR